MSLRHAHLPVLILVPLLLAACVPGAADPEGGRAISAVTFGGRTFNETPGSVLGCEVAYCIEGAGCHACAGEPAGCTPWAGCVAPEDAEMGAGELCSPDGCTPSGCFPAFCTAAGLCTVCDDGDPATKDECINYAPSPCRHTIIDGPDATGGNDAGGPGLMDAVIGTELPGGKDVSLEPDPIEPRDTAPQAELPGADASIPGDLGQAGDTAEPNCQEVCLLTCQEAKICEKLRAGEFPLLPPGWMKGKKDHCDRGLHLGWLKGRHLGWLKKLRNMNWEDVADDLPSCEEACTEICSGAVTE